VEVGDLDAATMLCAVSILKGLCHLNDVRVDQRHVHIHQVTYIERTTWQRRRKRQRRLQRQRRSPRRRAPRRRNNSRELASALLKAVSASQALWRTMLITRSELLPGWTIRQQTLRLAPCATGWAANDCCTWVQFLNRRVNLLRTSH